MADIFVEGGISDFLTLQNRLETTYPSKQLLENARQEVNQIEETVTDINNELQKLLEEGNARRASDLADPRRDNARAAADEAREEANEARRDANAERAAAEERRAEANAAIAAAQQAALATQAEREEAEQQAAVAGQAEIQAGAAEATARANERLADLLELRIRKTEEFGNAEQRLASYSENRRERPNFKYIEFSAALLRLVRAIKSFNDCLNDAGRTTRDRVVMGRIDGERMVAAHEVLYGRWT